jgi:hypothetical protein
MPVIIDQKGQVKEVNTFVASNTTLMANGGFVIYNDDLLPYDKKTLIRLGELPNSDGGIINPGFITDGESINGLIRVDANFEGYFGHKHRAKCRPVYMDVDKELNIVSTKEIALPSFDIISLIEDYRIFTFKGRTFASCAMYQNNWQQVLFELKEDRMELIKRFDSGRKEEKNWGWFGNGDKLHYIQSLSPYIIYEFDLDTMESKQAVYMPSKNPLGKSILSVSSLPVKYGEGWLLWVHCKHGHYYAHAPMVLGADMLPKYFVTHNTFKTGEQKEVIFEFNNFYISCCVVLDGKVYIFSAEGEALKGFPTAATTVRIIDCNDLDELLNKYPCEAR